MDMTDQRVQLREGDVLLLYTDGLVNVRCQGRTTMSTIRLCSHLRQYQHLPAQELAQTLLADTIDNCEPTDDITMLLVKRENGEEDARHD
jgi:serine phosphatase RsbU (regulator of sigma subunit)